MGLLPFIDSGSLRSQDGTVLVAALPISVWRTRQRSGDAAEVFDYAGRCPLSYRDNVTARNVHVVINGDRYNVVEAVPNEFFPHVDLSLRRVKA